MALPALILASILGLGSDTKELRQLPGFRIWEQGQIGYSRAATPGVIRFRWAIRFKNETTEEVSAVGVRLVAKADGRQIFASPIYTMRRFVNVAIAHAGSILPYDKTEMDGSLAFEMPGDLWRTNTEMQLEVASISISQSKNLHDFGHLYTRLLKGRTADNIALIKKDSSLVKVKNGQGTTGTLAAFAVCDPEVIRYVLAHGGSPKEKTERGATITHMAALNGYPGVLDLAVKLGGKVDAQTANGRTPLMKAIVHGMPIGWKWLLKHGAKPDLATKDGTTAAKVAIDEGQAIALSDLVQAGANRKLRDSEGKGWLEYGLNNYVFLNQVSRYGFAIDERNPKTGDTPLMVAAHWGKEDAAAWLLQKGANPDLKDRTGRNCYEISRLSNTLHTDRFFRALVEQYRRHV